MPTYPREVRIPDAPHDEVGTPDHEIARCSTHDVLYRRGQSCLVCEREGDQ